MGQLASCQPPCSPVLQQGTQQQPQAFLSPVGQPQSGAAPRHDSLVMALLGLLHRCGAAGLGAAGEVPGGEADGRLQHRGASRF